jgi:hypothetical protein
MTNQGVAPLDPGTLVGQVRALIGDTAFATSSPAVTGLGDYSMFSDADLAAFLKVSNSSVNRAVGNGYMRIAGSLALKSADAKAQDMAVDISKRADQFTKLAQQQFALADQDDQLGRNPANNLVVVISPDVQANTFSIARTPFVEEAFGPLQFSSQILDGSLIIGEPGYYDTDHELTPDPNNPGYLLP